MKISTFERLVSKERLYPYHSCTSTRVKAESLYRINLSISKAFYPVLSLLEVSLRNQISQEMERHFADPDWIINQDSANGFMQHPSLSYSYVNAKGHLATRVNDLHKRGVAQAKRNILKHAKTLSSGRIIAEQTFGFWTELFEPNIYSLVGGRPIHAFPGRPKQIKRNHLYNKLDEVRRFRNRVYHNEPIIFSGGSLNWLRLKQISETIKELMLYMEPELHRWCRAYFLSIDNLIQRGLKFRP